MLIYLDGVRNPPRGSPTRTLAREVMELFTLGEGTLHRGRRQGSARAFSGWSLERGTGTFVVPPALHDPGEKTVLGRTGPLRRRRGARHPARAAPRPPRLIVAKLWREFVSPDPDEARRCAASRPTSAAPAIGSRCAVEAPEQRRVLVAGQPRRAGQSPVELVVGTLRSLEVAPDDATPFALAAAGMGQNLFSPPNVKGWRGGDAWIDSSTLLARKQFVESISRYEESRTMRRDDRRRRHCPRPARCSRRSRRSAPMPTRMRVPGTAQDRASARPRVPRPCVLGARASWRRCRATRLRRSAAMRKRCCCRSRPRTAGRRFPQDADALAFVRLTHARSGLPTQMTTRRASSKAAVRPRRRFGALGQRASVAFAAAPDGAPYRNLLVLVELKGRQRRAQHARPDRRP